MIAVIRLLIQGRSRGLMPVFVPAKSLPQTHSRPYLTHKSQKVDLPVGRHMAGEKRAGVGLCIGLLSLANLKSDVFLYHQKSATRTCTGRIDVRCLSRL